MVSIVTSNYYGLILFVWVASVLTSPANHESRTDGGPAIHPSNTSLKNASSENDHRELSSSTARLTSESISSVKLSAKNILSPSVVGEGGPISVLSTVEHTSPVVSQLTSISKPPNSKEIALKEEGNSTVAVTEKSTQSKIFPRKGAIQQDPDAEKTSTLSDKASMFNNTRPVVEHSSMTDILHISEQHTNLDASLADAKTNVKNSSDSSNINSSSTLNDTSVLQAKLPMNITLKPSPASRKHKPKPTVTIGEPYVDKPIPASPTKTPPLGMPRKIDYIIPVVITIISVPLLGAATFIVYRRGRDCWDKRHYRRMDFLIDGMYND